MLPFIIPSFILFKLLIKLFIYNFKPKIITVDYSYSLNKALINEETNFFFHFCQALIRKMKLLKFKINKKNNFIIAKNIELISFINPDITDMFIKNLNINLNKTNEEKILISMNKMLKDSKLEKHEIIRHYIKTQTLISISFNE